MPPTTPPTEPDQPVFRALADPTRRRIIAILARGPRPVSEIASKFDISRPAVAKHLAILRQSGLVIVEKKGRERINRLTPTPLDAAARWLEKIDQFWDARLAALKDVVEESYDKPENH